MSGGLQEQLQRALGHSYLLERELGGGGMSRVFCATEQALDRKVVVKVLLPELAAAVNVERFRREIQLAAQLQHPHIVPLLSAGEADGLPYFIMPFVTGESLRTRVTREGELPIPETLRILRDVVSALAYAHARGIIHRDVKPDNVLLSGGVAVVTDFGVAKAVSASSGTDNSSLTSHGVALGTPAYMAPEQATATPNTDHRADIYALGIMAYEMLIGTPPFSGRSAQQVLAAHVVEEPEPVERRRPAVPPSLAALVRACLAKRPADRPQTATEVMHALDAIVTPSGGSAATTAVRLPTVRSGWRRKPLVAALFGLAVLLSGGVLWLRHSGVSESSSTSANVTPAVPFSPRIHPESLPPSVPEVEPPAKMGDDAARQPRAQERATTTANPATSKPTLPRPPRANQPVAAITPPEPPPVAEESTVVAVPAAPPAPAPPPPPVDSTPTPTAQPIPQPPPRPVDPMPAIRGVVAEYARAIESQSLGDLRRVYPGMTPTQQRGWAQFFQLVRDVKADLSITRLDRTGNTVDAEITGTYNYLNTSTGRAESQPVSFHASFRNLGGQWRINQVR